VGLAEVVGEVQQRHQGRLDAERVGGRDDGDALGGDRGPGEGHAEEGEHERSLHAARRAAPGEESADPGDQQAEHGLRGETERGHLRRIRPLGDREVEGVELGRVVLDGKHGVALRIGGHRAREAVVTR
jgi:hypothetical protein